MKYVFTIINVFLIAATAYFCVELVYKKLGSNSFTQPDKDFPKKILKSGNQNSEKQRTNKNRYNAIAARNLFKVDIEEKKEYSQATGIEDKAPENLEATKLKLVLLGTVTGGADIYAVIEDKKVRQQTLYQIGDSVQGAKIKKISRSEVILTFQGTDQILEMKTEKKNTQNASLPNHKTVAAPPPESTPDTNIIPREMAYNLRDIVKQVKFRPHFTDGAPDGLLLYGIGPSSVFRKMGLRNGDIIKDINGTPIVSAEDASIFFTGIETSDKATLSLLRRGKTKELFFQNKNKEEASKGDE